MRESPTLSEGRPRSVPDGIPGVEVSSRWTTLDVFRGLTVCFMILVNSPGIPGVAYGPLLHARWHGFTPTDLVFPTFLFIVGLTMAVGRKEATPGRPDEFWKKTLRRTALIFLLGYLSYWFPFADPVPGGLEFRDFGANRILGVLQRIALCFLLAAIVFRYGSRRVAVGLSVGVLLGYWGLLRFLGDPTNPYGLQGNAEFRLDLWLIGERRMYHGEGVAFEPEGILSTFPSGVNVVAGFLAGDLLRRRGRGRDVLPTLAGAGALSILLALAWGTVFPINKKLWTSSFALLTIGLDLVMLPLLIGAVERWGERRWTRFFGVFGRNPLFLYLLSELLLTLLSMNWWGWRPQASAAALLQTFAGPLQASLLFAVLYVLLCWSAGWLLDRKGIRIRV